MSNSVFSNKKMNVKKSGSVLRVVIGLSIVALVTGIGYSIYQFAGEDSQTQSRRTNSRQSHEARSSGLPSFATSFDAPSNHLGHHSSKAKKQKAKSFVSKGKKSKKRLAHKRTKHKSKLAHAKKHGKKANLAKLSKKSHRLAKHKKHKRHIAKHHKKGRHSKHLASK